MKYFVIFIVAVGLGLLFYNHATLNEWTLIPRELTPEEKKLVKLEKQLEELNDKIAELERSVSLSNSIGGSTVNIERNRLIKEREELERSLKEYREFLERKKKMEGL